MLVVISDCQSYPEGCLVLSLCVIWYLLSSRFSPHTVTHYLSLPATLILQKLAHMGRERDERYASDVMHSYDYEGNESVHGSVGCCSEQGDKENLDFLNTLGPKFKTLGEVCTKRWKKIMKWFRFTFCCTRFRCLGYECLVWCWMFIILVFHYDILDFFFFFGRSLLHCKQSSCQFQTSHVTLSFVVISS